MSEGDYSTTTEYCQDDKGLRIVWVLLGLLVLYIVSINQGSAVMFAAGNLLVEALLLGYILKNRSKRTEPETPPPSR